MWLLLFSAQTSALYRPSSAPHLRLRGGDGEETQQPGQETLAQALAGARSVQTLADPHVGPLLPPQVVQREAAHLFPAVRMHCTSFSAWWNRTTRGMKTLNDLPGLAAG